MKFNPVQVIFALVALAGLCAALRPDSFMRWFLADWQRRQISPEDLPALKWTAWLIFAVALVAAILIGLGRPLDVESSGLDRVLFALIGAAYLWWGTDLLLRPEVFLKKAKQPATKGRISVVRTFGMILLIGAYWMLRNLWRTFD